MHHFEDRWSFQLPGGQLIIFLLKDPMHTVKNHPKLDKRMSRMTSNIEHLLNQRVAGTPKSPELNWINRCTHKSRGEFEITAS